MAGLHDAFFHIRVHIRWQKSCKAVQRPVNGHGPLIATHIERTVLLEDGVANSLLTRIGDFDSNAIYSEERVAYLLQRLRKNKARDT